MAHLGLGSSLEEPWGLFAHCCWGEMMPPWEPEPLAWGIALSAWKAWKALSLDKSLTTWEDAQLARETSLPTWEIALPDWEGWEALSLAEHLIAWKKPGR